MKKTGSPPTTPTEAVALWAGEQRFLTNGSSGHALVLDADRQGNSAPGPMEMVLRSLCACSATDLVIVLKKSRQPLLRLEVSARGERAREQPTVYTRIHMVYRAGGAGLDRAVVERAVALSHTKYCSVFLMLNRTAVMSHEIVIEAAEGAARPAIAPAP